VTLTQLWGQPGGADRGTERKSAGRTVAGRQADGYAEKRAMLISALGRDRLVIGRYTRNGKRAFDKSRLRLIEADAPVADA
jgi:hypothetical protein